MHPPKSARDLHIDFRILAQPDLSLTACVLLAEVLDLYQVKGQVFANDAHFAARCRCSERTVRSTISELEEGGYLEREVNAKRSTKRLLVPTEKWQILPEVVANSAGSTPEVPANSAGTRGENCQESRQNLPRVPANSANINTYLNTKGNTTLNNNAAGAAELSSEKKIGEGFSSASPALAPASHTEGGAADVATSVITKKKLLMRDSPCAEYAAFSAFWQAAAQKNPATYTPYADADLLYYHDRLLGWSNAEGKTKFDWLSTIRNSMGSDDDKGLLRRLGAKPGPASQVSQRQANSNALRARYQNN